jgi:dTDP-4-dehydrorhamnose reductase
MKVLVLGANGMLGNAVTRILSEKRDWEVFGTLRSWGMERFFPREIAKSLVIGVDVDNLDTVVRAFEQIRPDVVVNCIGLVKQLADANDPLLAIPINALLPHRLAKICELSGARLIHMSTDCVFSGEKGGYRESDLADARDLYGLSKYLGEVDYPHAVTLRTSLIGHELLSAHGLVDWFLSQQGKCNGYTRAIFSGLPTVTLAEIIRDVVIPRPDLHGVYHVASSPIAKYDLLKLIAEIYGKKIEIVPDERLVINRSLNAEKFYKATDYIPPSWPDLVKSMHEFWNLSR